jgi:hypothetical protein
MFSARCVRALSPRLAAVALASTILASGAAHAQTVQDLYVTDGPVYSVAREGNTIYLAGAFNRVGPSSGCAVPFDATTGLPLSLPKVVGEVLAVAPDGSGGWFIGGIFWYVAGVPRYALAHILADHTLSSWNPNPSGPVRALAVSNGVVYAAGNFTSIGGQPRNCIAALDPNTGLATSWNPNAGALSHIYALAADGATIYAGGDFTSIGGQAVSGLAALDATTGLAAPWYTSPNGNVRALAVSGGTLVVGGDFTVIGGQARNRIASFIGPAGPGLSPTAWDPNANGSVLALDVSGSTIYAGGSFTSIGGQARSRIAAIDATSGLATPWDPNASWTVAALAVSGSTVYAGGDFAVIGGQARSHVAALDATTGQPDPWDPGLFGPIISSGIGVTALARNGATVFVGGNYVGVGGQTRRELAAIDATTGVATSWNPDAGVNQPVRAMVVSGGTVYVGGQFSTIGGQPRGGVAAIDAATGLPTDWNPGVGGTVWSLAVEGGTVYVGGQFSTIGGQPRVNLAAIDAVTGLATGWNPTVTGLAVWALAANGGTVYAGGTFSSAGGQPRASIAALDAVTGLATAWNPGASGSVRTIVPSGGTVYVGGQFSSIGGQSRLRIAALDAATGLATPWNPSVTNCCANSTVRGIALGGQTVYLGGEFERIGGQARVNLGAVDLTTGLATPRVLDASATVYSLCSVAGSIYAGGVFDNTAGYPQSGVAGLVDATVSAPDSGGPPTAGLALGSVHLSPNPTAGPLLIEYSLEREARVTIGLYDLQGREVARVLDGVRGPGQRSERWSPADARLPIGLYVVRVSADGRAVTRRVALLR